MAKFVQKKSEDAVVESKKVDKKQKLKQNKPAKLVKTAPAQKPTKVTNGDSPQKQKQKQKQRQKPQKQKKDKKPVSEETDDDDENISSEVGELLARLRQEHGLPEDANVSIIADASPVKKEKAPKKKNKVAEPKAVESKATQPKVTLKAAKPAKSTEKPAKPTEKPAKAPKQNNKKRAIDQVESSESSPAKVTKLNNGEKGAKKGKQAKKEQKVAVESQDNSNVSAANVPAKKQKKDKKKAAAAAAAVAEAAVTPAETVVKKNSIKEKQKQKKAEKVKLESAGLTQDQAHEQEEAKAEKKDLSNTTKVYVGNLPLNIKAKQVKSRFWRYGKVLSVHIRNNCGKRIHTGMTYKKTPTNTPFLIAFVFFEDPVKAKASLELNGTNIGGNIIKVELHNKNNVIDTGLQQHQPQRTIFVGSLPYGVTELQLRDAFKCCGEIDYVRVLQCEKGCKGTAFICFKESGAVSLALKLDKTLVMDREIHVERYHTKKLGGGQKAKDAKEHVKTLKGAEKRLAHKDGASPKSPGAKPKGGFGKKDEASKKKTKEFLGTKTDKKKKVKKQQKKKGVTGLKLLAKKVAPKAIKAEKPAA